MQLVGVYRNCICIAGLKYAAPAFRSGGVVDLATDTQEHRESWKFWWDAGCAALSFFLTVLLLSSFHEMWMKEKCERIIEILAEQEGEMQTMTPQSVVSEHVHIEGEEDGDVRDGPWQPLLRPVERTETVPVRKKDVPY